MFLTKVFVKNFKCLVDQELEFKKKVIIISGTNGQGKTSLLESIYILSHGKGFRKQKPKELISWNFNNKDTPICSSIKGDFYNSICENQIEYQIVQKKLENQSKSAVQKRILINSKNILSVADFLGKFQVMEFVPDDLELINGASQIRRNFFDRLIAMTDVEFVKNSLNYSLALKNRNAFLVKHFKGSHGNKSELEIWDAQLILSGLEISKKRAECIVKMQKLFTEIYSNILLNSENKNEKVLIKYEGQFFTNKNLLGKSSLEDKYKETLERDIRYLTTTFGVHRDKIDFLIGFPELQQAKTVASQGQRKSIVLALKIEAMNFLEQENENNELPILLLDDIEAELDNFRKNALYNLISNIKNQIFITTTSADKLRDFFVDDTIVDIFEVKNGLVKQV